jgi:hypothetical protein
MNALRRGWPASPTCRAEARDRREHGSEWLVELDQVPDSVGEHGARERSAARLVRLIKLIHVPWIKLILAETPEEVGHANCGRSVLAGVR